MTREQLKKYLGKPLVVLDTETTGFNYAGGDEIIELAAIKVVEGKMVDKFHSLIRPTVSVPPEAVAIHGLTDNFLQQKGEWAKVVFPNFADFMSGTVLVGHNIRRFDYPFIAAHFLRIGLSVPQNDLLDTLELSRAILRLPNHRLGTIAEYFGISTNGAHRAMRDVEITYHVLQKLLMY